MAWLFHPLLLLIARSTESQLAAQLEFLKAENQMLRRRLGKQVRPTAVEWELLLRLGRAVGTRGVRAMISIVSYRSWQRRARQENLRATRPVASRRSPGRKRMPDDVRQLVLRLARENPGWGYTRVLGELRKLGVHVCRTTVVNIIRADGRDPRLDPTKGTWAEFLRAHADTLWQCDFFSKHVATPQGVLRQCFALVFVHVASRRVWVSPATFRPDPAWMVAQARAFVTHAAAAGLPAGVVLRDNDSMFYRAFNAELAAAGAAVKRLAIRAPNTNAYVERFVQAIQQECLDKFIAFGAAHMDHLIVEYVAHYHAERPHQGKGNRPLSDAGESPQTEGAVVCRERLGGVLRHYYRAAA